MGWKVAAESAHPTHRMDLWCGAPASRPPLAEEFISGDAHGGRLHSSGRMAASAPKLVELFSILGRDELVLCIGALLDEVSVLNFMSTSSTLRARLLDDELWLDKLTVLANLYPGLAHLEQGGGESVFSWYMRWRRGISDAEHMARAHVNGERPYMRMYGTFQDGVFIPHTPLRLPATYGLIVETMHYCARSGKADPAYDAALMFNAPEGADSSFSVCLRRR